jgi:hypothetical protein
VTGEPAGPGLAWPVRRVAGAVVAPLGIVRGEAGIPFRFGGFDADGAVLPEMRLHRFAIASHDPVPPAAGEIAALDAECVHGGVAQAHFGHFLLEGLARVWAIARLPAHLPVLWHGTPRAAWQRDLLLLAGIDPARCVPIDRALRLPALLLPEPGFVIGHSFHPWQRAAMALHAAPPHAAGPPLWLSRAGLQPARRRVDGEAAVEAILAAAGWRILAPERHPVAEQLAALADAPVVAGIDGSAFHLLMLLRGFAGRVVMVGRRPIAGSISRNHRLILDAQGVPLGVLGGLLRANDAGAGAPPLRFADPAAAAAAVLAA